MLGEQPASMADRGTLPLTSPVCTPGCMHAAPVHFKRCSCLLSAWRISSALQAQLSRGLLQPLAHAALRLTPSQESQCVSIWLLTIAAEHQAVSNGNSALMRWAHGQHGLLLCRRAQWCIVFSANAPHLQVGASLWPACCITCATLSCTCLI